MLETALTAIFTALFRAVINAAEQAKTPSKPLKKDFPRADAAEKEATIRVTEKK